MSTQNQGTSTVYIATNPSFPEDWIKIGETDLDVSTRMVQLSQSTSIPLPFECYYAARVADRWFVESTMHEIFAHHRIANNKEFFKLPREVAKKALSLAAIADVTPVNAKQLTAAQNAKLGHVWDLYDLPIGADLVYVRDMTKHAKLVAKKQLEYNGKIWSLSALAKHLMAESGQNIAVTGEREFLYEGEMLQSRRQREQSDAGDSILEYGTDESNESIVMTDDGEGTRDDQ